MYFLFIKPNAFHWLIDQIFRGTVFLSSLQPSPKLVSPKIINLSSYKLTDNEKSILSKGLKFCPTPGTFNNLSHANDNSHDRTIWGN